jgi:hypothetical protein
MANAVHTFSIAGESKPDAREVARLCADDAGITRGYARLSEDRNGWTVDLFDGAKDDDALSGDSVRYRVSTRGKMRRL